MELDFPFYLRAARDMYREVAAEWATPIAPKDILLNDYLNMSVTLNQLLVATNSVNLNVPGPTDDNEALVTLYARGVVQMLLISLKQQWTHLINMEEADLAVFARFPQMRLNHQFIGIETMLLNSYHQKRHADFSHAWRSYLKLGLNELKISPATLDEAIRRLLKTV
ncbi:dUTPase [Weissella soli]|uniref:dUTPase n=1 Tax=Weissella soli TaxID=155866 RepID=UPI0035A02708